MAPGRTHQLETIRLTQFTLIFWNVSVVMMISFSERSFIQMVEDSSFKLNFVPFRQAWLSGEMTKSHQTGERTSQERERDHPVGQSSGYALNDDVR